MFAVVLLACASVASSIHVVREGSAGSVLRGGTTRAAANLTSAIFVTVPRNTRCPWLISGGVLTLAGDLPRVKWEADVNDNFWLDVAEFEKNPLVLAGICGKPAGARRADAMLAQWRAELALAWSSIPALVRADNSVVKVISWPEWTFRAIDGDEPISAAEYKAILAGIQQSVAALGDVSIFIVPGTFYWGVQLPPAAALAPLIARIPGYGPEKTIDENDAAVSYYCFSMESALDVIDAQRAGGSWAMFNTAPRVGHGGRIFASHSKSSESEVRRSVSPYREVWGRCFHMLGGAAVLGDAAYSILGESPFNRSIEAIDGRAYGIDVCADHSGDEFNLTSSKRVANFLLNDKRFAGNAALDLQVVLGNYKAAEIGDKNIRVKLGGYVTETNGAPGVPPLELITGGKKSFVWLPGASNDASAVFRVTQVTPDGAHAVKMERVPMHLFPEKKEWLVTPAAGDASPHAAYRGAYRRAFRNEMPWVLVSDVLSLPASLASTSA